MMVSSGRLGDIFSRLLGQVRHMDEAYLGGAAPKVVQQGIENIVADKRTGGIGQGSGDLGLSQRGHHFPHRDGGKQTVGPTGDYRGVYRCEARVIRDGSLPQIDADDLRSDPPPAAGLSDANNDMGLQLLRHFQNRLGAGAKHRGDLQTGHLILSNNLGQAFHRLPGGIDAFTSKGVKAGNQ